MPLWLITTIAAAQSSTDAVHIAPREKSVDVARADYSAPYSGGALIRTSSNLVLVPVSITDDRNRPVVGLQEDNFQLFENKKQQQIKNFSSEDTPVSIGILLDTSGSMGDKLERARDAVLQFCEASNPDDEFFLITFADQPHLLTDFTTRSQEIANALVTASSKGHTSLLDAIYLALRRMREARYGRRALLIISDGGDNHSRFTEHDVKAAVREADLTIYAIGTYDQYVSTQEELLGPELLNTIAEETGGTSFSLASSSDMPAVSRNIGTRLRHQYVLAYAPQSEHRDGKWHKINVKLRLPKKFAFLHVSARHGYYATEE